MIKLKIISFFLSLLLTIQLLPIQQIGNILSQNQWTEELPHSPAEDSGKGSMVTDFNHPYLPPAGFSAINSFSADSKALAYIHSSEQIPSNHSADIVIPPPDTVI